MFSFAIATLGLCLATRVGDPLDVFVAGEGGYPAYRIPSLLVSTRGTLLAFAEGRSTLADHASNDLVLRRSLDGGASFGPVATIQDAGEDALNNPCAVEVHDSAGKDRVLLLYQRYPADRGEYQVEPGLEGGAICRTFSIESSDEGATWSTPREITAYVKDELATSLACGPGVGLQKRRAPHMGRVVIPFNRGPGPHWKVFAAFSDDFCATWQRGKFADDSYSQGAANETQMVELGDGSLLLNARSMGGKKRRKLARSTDGGATWSPLLDASELVEPQVMGSLLRTELRSGESSVARVFYSGPCSETARENGHLWVSADEGTTWRQPISIAAGSFGYSCLAVLPSGDLGVLYEADEYRRIRLARVAIEDSK